MNFTPSMLLRIKDLLASPLVANQQLALTLIQAHGLPADFRDELLVNYLSGNDRPRVTLGIRLAKALGSEFLNEALWYRYLAVGTVGTSYGWVKSFLPPQAQEKAYQTFKKFGYPAPAAVYQDLEKLQLLLPELDTARLAMMICIAKQFQQSNQISLKVWAAFKYLVERGEKNAIARCLEAIRYKESLQIGLLTAIPAAITQLDDIKKLTIMGRGADTLATFPTALLEMEQLEELRLQVHRIREIPHEINQLRNLRILDLTFNPIESIPQTILEMPRLFVFAVSKPMLSAQALADIKRIQELKKPDLRIVLKSNEPLH